MKRLKENNVHLCAETALFVPKEMLARALPYIDLFYVDAKILQADQCREMLGGDLKQYQSNVETLFMAGKSVVFRVPVIGGFTDNVDNRKAILEMIKRYPPIKVELIKEHNLGKSKYLSLGKKPLDLDTVTDEMMEQYKDQIISETGMETEVCKI